MCQTSFNKKLHNCDFCLCICLKMNLKDNCAICHVGMTRGAIKRMLPCRHLYHSRCAERFTAGTDCPLCRGNIEGMFPVQKIKYIL